MKFEQVCIGVSREIRDKEWWKLRIKAEVAEWLRIVWCWLRFKKHWRKSRIVTMNKCISNGFELYEAEMKFYRTYAPWLGSYNWSFRTVPVVQ